MTQENKDLKKAEEILGVKSGSSIGANLALAKIAQALKDKEREVVEGCLEVGELAEKSGAPVEDFIKAKYPNREDV